MSYQLLDQPTSPHRRTSRLPALLRSRPVSFGAFAITALLLLSLGHSPTRTKLRTWAAGADKGEEGYVRPTREELLKMVGPNPRFLTKDGTFTTFLPLYDMLLTRNVTFNRLELLRL